MTAVGVGSTTVCLGDDWLETVPRIEAEARADAQPDTLLLHIAHRCTGQVFSSLRHRLSRNEGAFEGAFAAQRLVVLCRSVCMLPIGSQEENVRGVAGEVVLTLPSVSSPAAPSPGVMAPASKRGVDV
mmetsp:Transcript_34974/g.111732  ORF Transcript_34974/g.111732 Transcript_34974/m.111732 type:complete len:128 (+) Transcript_34974:750-1133(+)